MTKPFGKADHLDDDQLARLLGAHDLRTDEGKRCFAICLALVKLGVRKAELCDLNREDFGEYNRQMTVRTYRGKTARRRGQPTSRRQDRLLVDPELWEALNAYWTTLPNDHRDLRRVCYSDNAREGVPAFFTAPRNWLGEERHPVRLTPRSVDLVIHGAALRAGLLGGGIRISPHSLRATSATIMLRAGHTLAAVAAVLGHADLSSTLPYLRSVEAERFDGQRSIQPGRKKPRVRVRAARCHKKEET